jgi:hypothetical protein
MFSEGSLAFQAVFHQEEGGDLSLNLGENGLFGSGGPILEELVGVVVR